MEASQATATRFSPSAARALLGDLFQCRPAVYWADLLISLTLGYGAASIYFEAAPFSATQIVCYLVAVFALFRAATFIHEIAHLSGQQMRRFKIGWDLLAGVPLMMPAFMYSNHLDHHSSKSYGTGHDGEYLPLGTGSPWAVLHIVAHVFLMPLMLFIRFAVLTPFSFLKPRLRRWTLRRASSLVINLHYVRPLPRGREARWQTFIELLTSARAIVLVAAPAIGLVPWSRPFMFYLLATSVFGLKYLQMVVAHRYHSSGEPMSHTDQLSDSVNLIGPPVIGELFWPLGLRYHALHHLFPTLPYHNLTAAHNRLMRELPSGSVYHQATVSGTSVALDMLRAMFTKRRNVSNGLPAADDWYRRRDELRMQTVSPPARREPVAAVPDHVTSP